MIQTPSTPAARQAVTETLEQGGRRLRQADLLTAVTAVAAGTGAVALTLAVWRLAAPLPSIVVFTGVAVCLALVATAAVWYFRRHVSLAEAATRVDAAAHLRDELRSAQWFIESNTGSEWTDLQVSRAAQTAGTVDAAALFPMRVPRALFVAAGSLALAAALTFVPGGAAARWWNPAAGVLTAEERATIEKVAERLALADDPELKIVGERMKELLAKKRSSAELYLELAKLRELLEKAGAKLDASLVDKALAEMAEDLQDAASLEEVVAALKKQSAADAAEALRNAAARKLTPEEQKQMQDALRKAAERSKNDAGDELGKAADRMAKHDEGGADEALERAADKLSEMGRQQARQKLASDAAKDLEKLEQSLAQKSEQPGQGQLTDDAQQKSAAGEDAAMSDAEEFRAGAAGQGREAGMTRSGAMQDREGSDRQGQGGMAGGGGGGASRRTADRNTDIKLRQEQLPGQAPDPAQAPERPLVDRASKAATSVLPFRQSEAGTYRDAEPMTADTVPRAYQDLVKTYFHSLGSRRPHDH